MADAFHHIAWLKVSRLLLPLGLLVAAGTVFAWVSVAAFVQRNLILWSKSHPETETTLLGRPLLFPSRLTHARMFPQKYNYGINYFLVGIPVGLRGCVGSVMSIDSDGTNPNSPANKSFRSSVNRLFRKLVWFRIDPSHYLHRGDGHLSLATKLEYFLKEQGEDPTQYPYAYLISIPQFLWWTKSPISYWYLYSPSRELGAMIMEINNSYGEKKNAFFRLTREYNSCFDEMDHCENSSTATGRGSGGLQPVRFTSSLPTAKYYKGSWEKDIFASPFEKAEGGFTLRFMDPLDPVPQKGGPLHTNMTLITTLGKPKISSRLFSCGPPLDPLSASSWEMATFLLRWSFVIPVSLQRISVEALRLWFQGRMPWLKRPDVKRNNIPRNASEPERILESFFQRYLSSLVDECPFPLEVIYTPAKSLHLHPMSMHSSVRTLTSAPSPTLMIQPLTPQFYTNILKYSDAESGFAAEMENLPSVSDPVSQRLWVSDPVLSQKLIDSPDGSHAPQSSGKRLTGQKKPKSKTFMGAFIDSNCSIGMRRVYQAVRIRCYITENFAWGSYRLAAFYGFLLRMAVLWLLWKGLWWIWRMQCNSTMARSEGALLVSGICFMSVQSLRALSGYFYR